MPTDAWEAAAILEMPLEGTEMTAFEKVYRRAIRLVHPDKHLDKDTAFVQHQAACLSVGMEMIRRWFARSSLLPPTSHVPQQTAGLAPTKMPAFRWDYWASFEQAEEDSSDEEAAASAVPEKRGRLTKQRPLLIRITYRRKAILTAAGSFCPLLR